MADHCNDNKYKARTVQELSTDLFLHAFVEQCGSLEDRAMVTAVLEHAFDVLALSVGMVKRVYCDVRARLIFFSLGWLVSSLTLQDVHCVGLYLNTGGRTCCNVWQCCSPKPSASKPATDNRKMHRFDYALFLVSKIRLKKTIGCYSQPAVKFGRQSSRAVQRGPDAGDELNLPRTAAHIRATVVVACRAT